MWVFCARLEVKLLMKFTLPRKLCSSCLFAGGDIFRIACTFLGHGFIPLVETVMFSVYVFGRAPTQ